MSKFDNSHLIRELESGRKMHILLMSNNSLWPELRWLNQEYSKNCQVDVLGVRMDELYNLHRMGLVINKYDFIILCDKENSYNEAELKKIKKLASGISEDKNKRVSICYSYVIPEEERKNNTLEGIKIASFRNNKEPYENTTLIPASFKPFELADLLVEIHDSLEPKSVKGNAKKYTLDNI